MSVAELIVIIVNEDQLFLFILLFSFTNKHNSYPQKTANLLTKHMNRKQRPTFDTGCRLEVKYGKVVADVNFVSITDHPKTALWVEVAVT